MTLANPRKVPQCGTSAESHLKMIRRFGRFPGRNQALGRQSTKEEIEFLRQLNAGLKTTPNDVLPGISALFRIKLPSRRRSLIALPHESIVAILRGGASMSERLCLVRSRT